MPVRSSVCAYSPSSVGSNSKYSTVLPSSASSLSVGRYKPLCPRPCTTTDSLLASSQTRHLTYTPSHSLASSSASLGSSTGLGYTSSTYRPLSSSLGSSRYAADTYSSRYSSAGSVSSLSSASSAGLLLDRLEPLASRRRRLGVGSTWTPSTGTSATTTKLSWMLAGMFSFLGQIVSQLASCFWSPGEPDESISRPQSAASQPGEGAVSSRNSISRSAASAAAPASAPKQTKLTDSHAETAIRAPVASVPVAQSGGQSPSSSVEWALDSSWSTSDSATRDSPAGPPPRVGSRTPTPTRLRNPKFASSGEPPALIQATLGTQDSLPSGVPRGLRNLGNTCYMNASLQALYAVEPFRRLTMSAATATKRLNSELARLFELMASSNEPVNPRSFREFFGSLHSRFANYQQQDAEEFLRFLITGLHEEQNRAGKRSRSAPPLRTPHSAEEAWNLYREQVDDSPLVDLLVGQHSSTIRCGECANTSVRWESFWDMSLSLCKNRSMCRLSQLVDNFLASETLDSSEKPMCDRCKRPTRSTKQIAICRPPKMLLLNLKKFSNDGHKISNVEVRVDPTIELAGCVYSLKAAISHQGHSCSSGHYTSHCEYSRRWFHFNDDRVRDETSSFDRDNLTDAYVLIYLQTNASSKL